MSASDSMFKHLTINDDCLRNSDVDEAECSTGSGLLSIMAKVRRGELICWQLCRTNVTCKLHCLF